MAGVIAVPTLAFGESDATTVVVTDAGFVDSVVEIPAGGTVAFSYPSGTGRHNVLFEGPQPTSCRQTAGDIWSPNPPLPWYTQGPGWAGECTFDAPGTYPFRSQGNFALRGSVVVVATPTPTPSPTATPTATASPAAILAKESSSPVRNWFQDASTSDPDDHSVTVGPGGSVTFSYLEGASVHNVVFGTSQPASCTQTAGMITPAPPLPAFVQPAGWAGFCTFATVGTYAFVCSAHPEMTGAVVVEEDAPVPTPTPTPTVTATSTATATPTPTPTATPNVGGASATPEPPVRDARAAAVPKSWTRIDSIDVARRGRLRLSARCVSAGSGRLTLTVSKALARRLKLTNTTVGSGSGRCDANGRFILTVRPKRALSVSRGPIRVTATLRFARSSDRRTLTLAGKDGV